MHTPLEAILECPLPSTAGMNLRLDHDLPANPSRDLRRLLRSGCDSPLGGGDAKFFEEFASLVFVDVQETR